MYAKLILFASVAIAIWAAPNERKHDGMHPHFSASSTRSLKIDPAERTSAYWNENAQKTVIEKVSRKLNQNVAKNVILFLGDGMSVPTISAARVYLEGEEAQLAFETFPYTALSKTYSVDKQVPDSATTATAYLGGVKANYGTIGVGPEVQRDDCIGMLNVSNHVLSIAYYSQLQNKKTGLVTTARVTHASPAGVYAHTAERDWEADSDVLESFKEPSVCTDIATQLVYGETGKNLDVIMGGGRNRFLPEDVEDEEGHNGKRVDGVNLIDKWLEQADDRQYIWSRDDLLSLDTSKVDTLLGLFAHAHMDYNLDRDTEMDPSLAEMTKAAIEILSTGENGYFLFVEGARIDMAHHDTEARVALDETVEFSKAIQAAVDLTDESDTLIIVTADHAHTLSYGGYADRGNDILEFGGKGSDGRVYTTLSYSNGPGYKIPDPDGSRHDISSDKYGKDHYDFPTIAPLDSETHGGDDVAVYARGPWAHLFSGSLEQNVLPHLMAYASCVGSGHTACDEK